MTEKKMYQPVTKIGEETKESISKREGFLVK